MANQNEVTPVNAGQTSPADSSFSSPEPRSDALVQHFHVSPETMMAIERLLHGESGLANAPPARRFVAKKSKPGGLVNFLTTTAKVLALSSVVVVGPHLAQHHHPHHGPCHAGQQGAKRTAGRREKAEKVESGNLESGNYWQTARGDGSSATGNCPTGTKEGETPNIQHSTPNAEAAGIAVESVFVRGRFKYLAGCSEVWFDGEHFDLRKRHTARLCLDYLTGQNAWDELSARHLETEIDPQVRLQCQYPRPGRSGFIIISKMSAGDWPVCGTNWSWPPAKTGSFSSRQFSVPLPSIPLCAF
jgi:hypothetical protein